MTIDEQLIEAQVMALAINHVPKDFDEWVVVANSVAMHYGEYFRHPGAKHEFEDELFLAHPVLRCSHCGWMIRGLPPWK